MTPRPKSITCKSLASASATAKAASTGAINGKLLKHERRYCGAVGCTRTVKSQGLCQRHGAKPRKCYIGGCEKQAQGNFDGMCKSHFKLNKREMPPLSPSPYKAVAPAPPPAVGESVYDHIIPTPSLLWNPVTYFGEVPLISHLKEGFLAERPPAWYRNESVYDRIIPASQSWNPVTCVGEVPLIAHLQEGFLAERYRNEERRALGLWPVHNPAT